MEYLIIILTLEYFYLVYTLSNIKNDGYTQKKTRARNLDIHSLTSCYEEKTK